MTTLPLTRADLCDAVRAGQRFQYLPFWGHTARKGGPVGKACLSQWWPCTFEVEGIAYRSAEHFMMAEKARLFGDEATRRAVLHARTPGEAKKLGRQVTPWDDATWEAHRFDLVVAGNLAKFGQDDALGAFLRGTAGRVLVEASPKDRIWGIGLAETDPASTDPLRWRGDNLLGFALMGVRARLIEGQPADGSEPSAHGPPPPRAQRRGR